MPCYPLLIFKAFAIAFATPSSLLLAVMKPAAARISGIALAIAAACVGKARNIDRNIA